MGNSGWMGGIQIGLAVGLGCLLAVTQCGCGLVCCRLQQAHSLQSMQRVCCVSWLQALPVAVSCGSEFRKFGENNIFCLPQIYCQVVELCDLCFSNPARILEVWLGLNWNSRVKSEVAAFHFSQITSSLLLSLSPPPFNRAPVLEVCCQVKSRPPPLLRLPGRGRQALLPQGVCQSWGLILPL